MSWTALLAVLGSLGLYGLGWLARVTRKLSFVWLLAAWVLLRLTTGSVYLLVIALFLEALLSWTNPHAPFAAVLSAITGRFLRPFRRLVPPKGGLDFSFLILFFLCYVIIALPLGWLELLIIGALQK